MSGSKAEPLEINDLREALQKFELAEVVSYEHSGRRAAVEAGDEDRHPTSELEVLVRHEPGEIETRFRMTVAAPGMELVSDVGVVYKSKNFVLADSLVPDFLEEIGIMAAYPYLREGTATSAVRLGLSAPTLGLLHRGQFSVYRADEPREPAQELEEDVPASDN